jgi:cell division protein FtsL
VSRLSDWIVAALLLAVTVSGVQVAFNSQKVRQLHADLEEAQRVQDEELAEHSRLLLERGAQTSYVNVERVAEAELGMVFPDHVEPIEP